MTKSTNIASRMLGACSAAAAAALLASATHVFAAPGDILFTDDFEEGAGCANLTGQWSTTSTSFSGVGTRTSESAFCSLFTRGGAVTVTSDPVDLSSATGADLTVWVRKGADTFSEDPDTAGENLILEFLDDTGLWTELREFSATTLADGAEVDVDEALPFGALHSAVRFRFRQLGGSGGPPANNGIGWDYWHVDDFTITETGTAPPPPPTPDIDANSCDDFEDGLNNWTISDATAVGANNDTFNSASNALFLRHEAASATMAAIDGTALSQFTIWIRRGADSFSENPDGGENFVVEYFNASSVWVTLETFAGGGTPGQVFNRTYTATAAFRHANFRVRLSTTGGSGSDFDYWHVDDVCFTSAPPTITVSKTVEIESDPLSSPTPLGIPGALARYTIEVTNTGIGTVDADSLRISDVIDPSTVLFVGDLDSSGAPFLFTDGAGADVSGVSLTYGGPGAGGDGVEFRDSGGSSVTPSGTYDATVASFVLAFEGAMNGTGGGGTPSFTIEYRVRIE